jgi:uncharacterized repeat protein (TIGR03943 family)
MSRETENALLLLVGLSAATITVTGVYTRYVKPGLLPWLAAAAIIIVVLAVVAIVHDRRRDRADAGVDDGHTHRSAIVWLLAVPVVVLMFVTPPAIGPRAAGATVANVSTDVLRRPFPPLPAERAPTMSLPELLTRVAQDTAGTVDGRLITVTGFSMKESDHIDLARVVIICCAADARLSRIHLGGPGATEVADQPDNTWLQVEGKVPGGQSDSTQQTIPTLEVSQVVPIDSPANPYAY